MTEHIIECFENQTLGEKYYKTTHPSGLTVFVYPKKLSTAYVMFSTRYGSLERKFRLAGEKEPLTVPDGVAHFLEHKLFEEEDGSDVFAKFAALGASANAFTSHDMTSYLFSATDRIEESLEVLLQFVTHPYFTEENVKKEQGIIGQEIGMYDDKPSSRLYYAILEGLYQKHNVRVNIAGTVKTISRITPELLYRCYNAFYQLSNMVLTVCGDIELEKILSVVDRVLPVNVVSQKIERFYPEENKEIACPYTELRMSVATPLFAFGVKDLKTFDTPEEKVRHGLLASLLGRCYFSRSSAFFNELYDDGLIVTDIDCYYDAMSACSYLLISGESEDPMAVYEKTTNLLKNISENLPTEEDFARIKRAMYAGYIRSFDSTEELASQLTDHFFHGTELFRFGEILSSVTYEEFLHFAKTFFLDKEFALAVIRPSDEIKKEEA